MSSTTCPQWLEVEPDNIPHEMRQRDQWVVWRPVLRDGKWTKVPINARTGREAKANTPATWSPFADALAYAKSNPWNGNGRGVAGVGYVLAADDPFVGVDLDKCVGPERDCDGFAGWVVDQLSSYTEYSPSGTGLRILLRGKLPKDGRKKGSFEVYESGRFLTMTGQLAMEGEPYMDAIQDRQAQLDTVHARVFAPKEQTQQRPLSDHELLAKAYKSRNGRELERLMAGDITGHASTSEADLALCNTLAFWTGKDADRMDRIFRSSGLFRPEKWDKSHYADGRTYGAATIEKAIAGTRDTFGHGQTSHVESASTAGGERRENGPQPLEPSTPKQMPQVWTTAREVFPRTPFPWEVLPADVAASLKQLARSCAGSANPLPGAAFVIIAAALGRTLAVTPKLGWTEPAIIWHGDIRESGSGKTAPMWKLAQPLVKAQRDEDMRARDEQAEYDALSPKEKKDAKQPKPARSYFCSDATMEGLRVALHDHPTGGVVVILSELSAVISGQNQYKKQGNDREALLCLHDGKPARIVRAGKPAMSLYDARVSIVGGIQPGIFRQVFGGQKGQFLEDGTINRFIFTYEPSTHHVLTAEDWSEENAAAWDKIVRNALRWADNQDGLEPIKLILNQEAQGIFFSWRNDLDATKGALPQELRGFLAKAYGYALRLAGLLHVIKNLSLGLEPAAILEAEDIKRGIEAATFYLGQAVDCMATMACETAAPPVEVSERTQTLAAVLEDVEDDVDNGRLAVGYVLDKFNSTAPNEQKFNAARGFGAFLRGCGLTVPATKHHANGRAGVFCLAWDKRLEDFLRMLRTSRSNVLTPAGATTGGLEDVEDVEDVVQEEKRENGAGILREKEENIYPQCPQHPQSQEIRQPQGEDIGGQCPQTSSTSSKADGWPKSEGIEDEVEV